MKTEKDINSKQKILNAAIKLFAQKGYDAVSIREICREAGCNLCMISYWWGGKQELYNGIIAELIKASENYAKTFLDLSVEPKTLSKEEQVELLDKILEKCVDFFYANISNDLILLLLREQQKNNIVMPLLLQYLRKVVAAVLNKDENDRITILKTVFLISQINSPKILPAFSLGLMGQKEFTREDINIIKENVKLYVRRMLLEDFNNV